MKINKIIWLLTFFLFISFSQIQAAEIKGLRYYSETSKTRIVILANELTQYGVKYDLKNYISISFSKSDIKVSDRAFDINDGLVKAAALKKIDNNFVELTISLDRPSAFNTFTLDSPARFVIDVTPLENIIKLSDMIKPEVVQISATGDEEYGNCETTDESILANTSENNDNGALPDVSQDTSEDVTQVHANEASLGTIMPWFGGAKYILIQLTFTIMMLISLIYMSLKVKKTFRFARIMKRNNIPIGEISLMLEFLKSRTAKQNQTDKILEDERETEDDRANVILYR